MRVPGQQCFRSLDLAGASRTRAVVPATIHFSPNWSHYSSSNAKDPPITREEEEALVQKMVRGSSSGLVTKYIASTECDAFIRTGVHESKGDETLHVQVQLGLAKPPYESKDCPAYTCHVRLPADKEGLFPTECWPGIKKG